MSTSPTESLGQSPARDDPEVSFCDLSHNQEKKQGLTTSEARLWYEIKHLVCPGLVRSNKSVEVQGREMLDCLQVTEVHGSRGLTDGQPRKGRRRRRTVSDGASRGLLPTAVMVYHTSDHRSCRQQRRMLRSCAACRKHPLLYVVHGARANACCLHGHIRRCSGFASSHSHRPLTLATSSLQARHPEHLWRQPSSICSMFDFSDARRHSSRHHQRGFA